MSGRLSIAIRIADSANAILQRVETFNQKDYRNNEEWNMSAHIGIEPMLLALSMELALKAWFVFDYDTPDVKRSHDLSKLFKSLKPESQKKLNSEFRRSVVPYHPSFFFGDYEMGDVLEHHKNAFIDWRYTHEAESQSFNISTFIATLQMVLREFRERYSTEEIQPIWPSD